MECVFELRGVSRHISEDFSLSNVSLAAQSGEVVGFVGANGAGKTTVIRALLGLLHIDAGDVRLFGKAFGADASDAEQRRIRSRIGVVFDSCPYPADLTVKQAVACVSPAFSAWNEGHFLQLAESFNISPKVKIKELSRGMGMKLQLAVALSHGAELLVLDEATAGLDPMARDEILDMLRAFASEGRHAVLLSSHITTDLERIADRVAGIDAGRIAFDLSREAITDTAGIAHCDEAMAKEILAAYGAEAPRDANRDIAQATENLAAMPQPAHHVDLAELHGSAPSELPISLPRALRHEFSVDVLVPNRFVFARQFPDVACDRATIDDYLQFSLRGARSL